MKLTKAKLERIIKEEIQRVISEIGPLMPGGSFGARPPSARRARLGGVASGSPGLGAPSHDPEQVAEDPKEVEKGASGQYQQGHKNWPTILKGK